MITDNELKFSHHLIKGRIAEAIVTELFTLSGYEVHPFGIEHIAPSITKVEAKGCVAKMLRKSPDLLVRNKKNELFLIEVKYRKNGITDFKIDSDFDYNIFPGCFIILLGTRQLVCATAEELKTNKPFVPLIERREFTFERGLITQVLRWASEFLTKK